MFFIDTATIPREILTQDTAESVYDPTGFTGLDLEGKYNPARVLFEWADEHALPVIGQTNPERVADGVLNTQISRGSSAVTQVHCDNKPEEQRVYTLLTFSLDEDGNMLSTLFPMSSSFTGHSEADPFISDFTPEELERDFEHAPRNYASVFDGDREPHAAKPPKQSQREDRRKKLYKVTFRALNPPEHAIKLIAPTHESVARPMTLDS